MRLITFESGGEVHIGAQSARGPVDFAVAAPSLPTDMRSLLAAGPLAMKTARAALARALDDGVGLINPDQLRLLAPLPRPGKIFGIGLNYAAHAAETDRDMPEVPIVFSKAVTAVIGPQAPIMLPSVSQQVDYEGELAVVIGSVTRRVPRRNALSRIAGFTIMNDVTARDYQKRSGNCMGKSFDSFAPMGPAIVTLDEFATPEALDIRTWLNDEEVQHSNTRHLIFDIPALVEFLSAAVTLEAGDVITTGTPAGVGMRRNPPRFLQGGDVVRVAVEGVGELTNPVAAATH